MKEKNIAVWYRHPALWAALAGILLIAVVASVFLFRPQNLSDRPELRWAQKLRAADVEKIQVENGYHHAESAYAELSRQQIMQVVKQINSCTGTYTPDCECIYKAGPKPLIFRITMKAGSICEVCVFGDCLRIHGSHFHCQEDSSAEQWSQYFSLGTDPLPEDWEDTRPQYAGYYAWRFRKLAEFIEKYTEPESVDENIRQLRELIGNGTSFEDKDALAVAEVYADYYEAMAAEGIYEIAEPLPDLWTKEAVDPR